MTSSNDLKKSTQIGLEMIEDAIICLLRLKESGMTNTQIANYLGLNSSHEGSQKDYLSYSILGNLMEKGIVFKDKSGTRPVYKINYKNNT